MSSFSFSADGKRERPAECLFQSMMGMTPEEWDALGEERAGPDDGERHGRRHPDG